MGDQTADQKWCIDRAEFAENRGAKTVSALLRDAANHPEKATICRQEMTRAARGLRAIRQATGAPND